jgi:hypothetical protein
LRTRIFIDTDRHHAVWVEAKDCAMVIQARHEPVFVLKDSGEENFFAKRVGRIDLEGAQAKDKK